MICFPGRLIVLDKQSGVHPVGVGETWQRIFAIIFPKVTGPEATMACQDDQLCAGLKSGIDGAVHGVQALWGGKRNYGGLVILAHISKECVQQYCLT